MGAPSSFWSRFSRIDSEAQAAVMLDFLDRYAALEPAQEQKRHATDVLDLRAGERVLDVGCGTGVDLVAMAERVRPGGRVTGIDVSERAVEEANRRLAEDEDVSATAADVYDLPFPEGAFDAARADRTLQHLARPDAALAELHRVLSPGGRLVVLEVLSELKAPEGSDADALVRSAREQWATPEERRAWLPLMLPLLLSRAGFAGIAVTTQETASNEPDVILGMLAISERADEVVAGDEATVAVHERYARLREVAGDLSLKMRGVCLLGRAAPG
jgi:ubiquinone/menaquinone biosynthesis C-methylase UbiE